MDQKELTAQQHQALFAQFCQLEKETGGPDPHLAMVGWLCAEAMPKEKIWRIACYVGPYTVSAGMAIWTEWPWARIISATQNDLQEWIEEYWQWLPFRRERRAARTPEHLAVCLKSAASWIDAYSFSENREYESAWISADRNIKFMGRYALIKLLEGIYRYGNVGLQESPDIRPSGGWSPRLTLAYLFPEHEKQLIEGGNGRSILATCNEVARLARDLPDMPRVSWFELEVLLCNYRQILNGKYPGRPHDTELAYHLKSRSAWEARLSNLFFQARAALFPHACLGEISDWLGVREQCDTFSRYGYLWADTQYNYSATTDFGHPVRQSMRV